MRRTDYSLITHPVTKKMHLTNSSIGKQILRNYLSIMIGGSASKENTSSNSGGGESGEGRDIASRRNAVREHVLRAIEHHGSRRHPGVRKDIMRDWGLDDEQATEAIRDALSLPRRRRSSRAGLAEGDFLVGADSVVDTGAGNVAAVEFAEAREVASRAEALERQAREAAQYREGVEGAAAGGGGGAGGGYEDEDEEDLPAWIADGREICIEACSERGQEFEECLVCSETGKTQHGVIWEKPVCKYVIDEMIAASAEEAGGAEAPSISPEQKEAILRKWVINSEGNPTAVHDISPALMGTDWPEETENKFGHGISVKLIQKGCQICMGDLGRIFENFTSPWSMIVGFYSVKMVDGVRCLCVDKVYFVPLKPENRVDFFGEVGEEWSDDLELSRRMVKIAKTYKNGDGGMGGLIKIEYPFSHLGDENFVKKKSWQALRMQGVELFPPPSELEEGAQLSTLRRALTEEELLQCGAYLTYAARKCKEEIERLVSSLQPADGGGVVKTPVKLSKGNCRIQGAITKKKFLDLVERIGEDITEESGLTGPILKKS